MMFYENDPTYLLDYKIPEENEEDNYEENKWIEEERLKEDESK
jgi:hypothetical protein